MQSFRTLIFWGLLWPLTVFFTVLALFCIVIPHAKTRYWLITRWSVCFIFLSRHILNINYVIKGLDGLNLKKAHIIVANHQSSWETIFFQTLFPMQTWVLKAELLCIPLFGWALSLLGPIAIKRTAGRSAMQQVLQRGQAKLLGGIWVVVFPEGTRVKPADKAKKWGKSFILLARQARCPILPVAHNAGTVWHAERFAKGPGTITVTLGKAFTVTNETPEAVLKETQHWLETHKNA